MNQNITSPIRPPPPAYDELYPSKYESSPTVIPYPLFSPWTDARSLHDARQDTGLINKTTVIEIFAYRSNLQRLEIADQYKAFYKQDLIKTMKNLLCGDFKDLIVALLTPLPQFYAKELHKAMSGPGTNECVLIELLCTKSKSEVKLIRLTYKNMYGTSLEDDLRDDTSGNFKRLMILLCCANRDSTSYVDINTAVNDAKKLFHGGVQSRADKSTFNDILVRRNMIQLRQTFREYEKISGHNILTAIEREFSGDMRKGLLAIVKYVNNPARLFAEQLHKSMKGLGTDNRRLIRLVVTHCEIDMGEIKQAFLSQYGQTLEDCIADHCSGHYRKCLLALIS